MRVRIVSTRGYGDRFGVFHERGSEWEAPDSVGVKLVTVGVAVAAVPPTPPVAREEAPAPKTSAQSKPKTRGGRD